MKQVAIREQKNKEEVKKRAGWIGFLPMLRFLNVVLWISESGFNISPLKRWSLKEEKA